MWANTLKFHVQLLKVVRSKSRHRATWTILLAPVAMLFGMPLGAQQIPAPPYYVGNSEAVVIGIAYDETQVKEMVSSDVQIAPGATGVIVMYKANRSYGLPPYSGAFMAIDVDGFDVPGGGKARWMLTGIYSPGVVTEALAKYFYYPIRNGQTRMEREGRKVMAVGSMGTNEMISVELVLKSEPCQQGAGMVHEVTRKSGDAPLQLIKIAHGGDWCAAESAKVNITGPKGDPFGQIGQVKVLWSGYSIGGFSWSAPEAVR